ncbi:MAG: site-specific DNA-methyltransferase [Myxococcota bacterium]
MSDGIELRWPGKYDEHGRRSPVPRPGAQLRPYAIYPATEPVESAEPEGDALPPHWLIEGDNLLSLDALARDHAGTVDLVYIDPPFATGGRFEVVTAVGSDGPKLRQPAYTDAWPGGTAGLLAMLDPRLRLMHELLAPHGSLYVHVDPTVGHAVKLLLDEIFGPGCFQREIVWRIGWVSGFKTRARNWIRNHDLIFFYVKDPSRFTFNKHYIPHPPGYRRRDGSPPKGKGVPLDDVWNAGDAELALRGHDSLDSIQIKSFSTEKTGYATQKNESLLERIIEASSNPGDVVLDAFGGSGTTLQVAESLGRRCIACDTGRAAIHIATGRLLAGTRRRDLQIFGVADDERRAWQARVQEAGGEPERVVREAWATMAGASAPALRVEPRIEQSLGAKDEGAAAAWSWRVEVPVEPEGARTRVGEDPGALGSEAPIQLVLQRALFDARNDARPEQAFAERARVAIELHETEAGTFEVELAAVGYPTSRWLPEALVEAAVAEPLALAERWTVTWDAAEPGPIDAVMGRFARGRQLPTRSPAHDYGEASHARLVVAVHDVLHREHRLVCELSRAKGRLRVQAAWAEAGP